MIYKGVIPFVILQIVALISLFFFPQLITWLPDMLY
jgi:TRAP-type mannitol/chloroaromatic compound transport system permease large subunit